MGYLRKVNFRVKLAIVKTNGFAKSSSHAESSWCLNELTEAAVTPKVGSLFQYFTTRMTFFEGAD